MDQAHLPRFASTVTVVQPRLPVILRQLTPGTGSQRRKSGVSVQGNEAPGFCTKGGGAGGGMPLLSLLLEWVSRKAGGGPPRVLTCRSNRLQIIVF